MSAVTRTQVKKAAETIEGLASRLATSSTQLKTANERIASLEASAAQAGQAKVASEQATVALGAQAKKASAVLLQQGLISTPERADKFASEILNHGKAIVALEKFAHATSTAPRSGRVVEQGSEPLIKTADEVWDSHASQHLPA